MGCCTIYRWTPCGVLYNILLDTLWGVVQFIAGHPVGCCTIYCWTPCGVLYNLLLDTLWGVVQFIAGHPVGCCTIYCWPRCGVLYNILHHAGVHHVVVPLHFISFFVIRNLLNFGFTFNFETIWYLSHILFSNSCDRLFVVIWKNWREEALYHI